MLCTAGGVSQECRLTLQCNGFGQALRASIANTTYAITSRLSEAVIRLQSANNVMVAGELSRIGLQTKEKALSAEMCGGPPPPFWQSIWST